MPFDPNKLPENKKKIYAALEVQYGAVNAQELIQSLDSVSGKFRTAHNNLVVLEKGLQSLNAISATLSRSFNAVGQAVNSVTSFINAPNISMKAGYDILVKYNDSLVKTSSQFSKYGMGVSQYTKRVEEVRKAYQLSYQDATKLMSTLERGFNYNGPEKYDGYLKALAKTTGNNIEAMNELNQAVQSLTANNPALEDMVANLDFEAAESYARSLAMAGEISVQQYKTFKDMALAQNRPQGEQDKVDQLQQPGINQRKLIQGIESGLKKSGEVSADLIQTTVNWAGGIDNVNQQLEKTVHYYAEIQAAAGAISSFMPTISGALSGGLNILDAAADAKVLLGGRGLGGKILGRAGKALGAGRALLGLGTGAINGMGAAASGGSMTAIAGSGALIVGSAIGGFEAGDYIANKTGIGIYGWSSQMGQDAERNMALADKTEDPLKKAQLRVAALESKKDQEKTESLGGFFGMFRSEGVASYETLKALAEARSEMQEAKKTQQELSEEQKKQVKASDDLLSRQRHTNQVLEIQKGILSASNTLLASKNILLGKAAQTGSISSEVAKNNQELDIQEKILQTHKSQAEEQLSIAKTEIEKNVQRKIILEDEEQLNQIAIKRNENAKVLVNSNQFQIETQEKAISLQEAYISLQDSAGMGLKAQVGARKELIDQISKEMQMVREQQAVAEEQRAMAEQALQKAEASGNQQDIINSRARIRDLDNEILDKKTKETQLMQKQAEISKSMREGWISAISAMTTGNGVFTRITIDQNKRLGSLVSAVPDKIRALRAGGTTGGRRESASWTPGGFKEGSSGDWEQDALSQYGLNPYNRLQDNVSAMLKYQQDKGSKMSPAAATFGIGPQGTGEITTAIKEGFKTIGSDSTSGAKKMIVDEKDLEELKKSFIDAFSKIGTEIITETIKRIRNK